MLQQLSLQIRYGILSTLGKLSRNDATGGVIMLICTVLALILQNGSYSTAYRHWLDMSAGISFGNFSLEKPLLLWINDGLITIFFFSIGLELKIEFIKGHLSNIRNIILPSFAAIGGIIAPSLVFILFNFGDEFAMNGWAIPTATDTAFSVALILLLGYRVPASLKIFLLSMAIFDDIGAILVIALFYTSALSIPALIGAACAICGLAFLNYLRVGRSLLYFIVGILLWFSILKSGVHATLAGIVTAFFIPMQDERGHNMVEEMFEDLKVWVAMVVLPIFTIANAGVDLSTISIKDFFSPVSLGIFFGLVVGKQLGIFGVVWMCVKTRLVPMPEDANMRQVYGVCILTGIGFSMSMFIDTLAYKGSSIFNYADSLAILLASLVSGVYGFIFLRFYACKTHQIEYRPWLSSPGGYRGKATTANLFALEPKVGPSSVAPTAALVAAANARVAAANAAVVAANKAAAAAAEVAEAMQEIVSNQDDAESVAKVQAAVAAAAAAAADAAITSTHLDESEEHEDSLDAVQSAADAAQQAAVAALEVAEAAKVEAQAAKAASKAEEDAAKAEEESSEQDQADVTEQTADDSESAEQDQDRAEDNKPTANEEEESGLPTRIIKTVANVAKDTASIVADVATSILSKDEEEESSDKADSDKSKTKEKKAQDLSEDNLSVVKSTKQGNLVSYEVQEELLQEQAKDLNALELKVACHDDKSSATQDLAKKDVASLSSSKFEAEAEQSLTLGISGTVSVQDEQLSSLDSTQVEQGTKSKDATEAKSLEGKSDKEIGTVEQTVNKDDSTSFIEIAESAEQVDGAESSTQSKDDELVVQSDEAATKDEDAEDESEEDGDLNGEVIPLDAVYQAALESRGIITDRETAVVITKLQHSVAQSAQQLEVSALSKQERQETVDIETKQEPNEDVALAIKAQVNTLLASEGKVEHIENIEHIETAVKQLLDLNAAVAETTAKKTLDPKQAQRLDLNFSENQVQDSSLDAQDDAQDLSAHKSQVLVDSATKIMEKDLPQTSLTKVAMDLAKPSKETSEVKTVAPEVNKEQLSKEQLALEDSSLTAKLADRAESNDDKS